MPSWLQSEEGPQQTEFYFESDHPALKADPEYRALLRLLVRLESRKLCCVEEVEELLQARHGAVANPLAFLADLQRGAVQLPTGITRPIPALPALPALPARPAPLAADKPSMTARSSNEPPAVLGGVEAGVGGAGPLVRGRLYKSNKTVTFNQPWTGAEQRRLEELLELHPTRETEMDRWKTIAAELGNRTAVQVQSRVQKYFLKLSRLGLPVPGRLPPQRNKNRFYKAGRVGPAADWRSGSTFLASLVPPVRMEEPPVALLDCKLEPEEEKDEDELPAGVRETVEYRELRLLQRIRRETEAELESGAARHSGFSCQRCCAAPLLGTRWQCRQCSTAQSTSLCTECVEWHASQQGHFSYTTFRTATIHQSFSDPDYT